MKIAQVNLQCDYGGTERHVMLLSRGLKESGHEVILFCHPEGRLRRSAEEAGIRIEPTKSRNQLDLSAAMRLAQCFKKLRPEIVHLHTPKDYLSGTIAARLERVPVIVITRHMVLPVKSLMRRVYNGANTVVCPSRAVRDHLREQGISEQKLELIYNAIDTDEFASATGRRALIRAEFKLEQDEICIGCVGRLVRGKGHDNLLKAAAQLNGAGAKMKFLIVGDGLNRSALRARAEQLGLADKVVFAGYRADMPAVMSALDVFALPSDCAEGLPMALIEAMAAGRAVVATRVGGVSEIVEHEASGMLVPSRDSSALAESLQRLIIDSSLRERLGAAAKRRTQQRFALPRKIAETERIYERLLYHRAYHQASQRETVGEGKPTSLDQI